MSKYILQSDELNIQETIFRPADLIELIERIWKNKENKHKKYKLLLTEYKPNYKTYNIDTILYENEELVSLITQLKEQIEKEKNYV